MVGAALTSGSAGVTEADSVDGSMLHAERAATASSRPTAARSRCFNLTSLRSVSESASVPRRVDRIRSQLIDLTLQRLKLIVPSCRKR